jgi:hypothetical protein
MHLDVPPRILKSTALILGAGASCDVNYPTNPELIANICLKFAKGNGHRDKAVNDRIMAEGPIDEFIHSLEMSQKESIDQFLQKRTEFEDIGRFAIASELISVEDETLLMRNGRKSWYYGLRRFLGDSLGNHNIRIVTFNYDRSFEHYLFSAIKNSTGLPDVVVADEMSKLGIQHVHGQLSPLPWQFPEKSRPYSNKLSGKEIWKASRDIRLTHQNFASGDDHFSPAEVVETSEQVYFLVSDFMTTT